jgi:hypothetical protein
MIEKQGYKWCQLRNSPVSWDKDWEYLSSRNRRWRVKYNKDKFSTQKWYQKYIECYIFILLLLFQC